MGLTMKHAGVAITVTSFTDICAFAVGCITILPGLSSFCMTCAVGIAATYILQITWFTAWLSVDTMRITSKRDGCIPCCLQYSSDWEPFQCIKYNISEMIMKTFSSLLSSNLYRISVVLITAAVFSIGLYGAITIKQEFDEVKMLPADSYLREWFDTQKSLYPTVGTDAYIYTGALHPATDLEKMDTLIDELQDLVNEERYLTSVDSWWTEFKTFLFEKYKIKNWKNSVIYKNTSQQDVSSDKNFKFLLSDFLFTPIGAKYKDYLVLNGTLLCNKPAPAVLASSTSMVYRRFEGRAERSEANRFLEELISKQNFSSKAFSFSHVYRTWETVEIIGKKQLPKMSTFLFQI